MTGSHQSDPGKGIADTPRGGSVNLARPLGGEQKRRLQPRREDQEHPGFLE